jgi:hypothetical protein
MARTAVVAGTASAVAGNVQHRQQQKWSNQEAEQMAAQAPAPQAYTPPQDDMTAQLQQLATLKDQGILTQEEFDAKKKQILGI